MQKDEGDGWVDASGRIDINSLLAKKVDKRIEGSNGVAEIFNEADGGGAHFVHNDGSESFVGVNDGGKDGMMAQIYADVKENGAWVGSRINVYHDGIYYVSKAAQLAGSAKNNPDREIATLADIKALGNVLRFRGIFDSLDDVENPEAGDVAIVGEKEYIYCVNGGIGAWKEFGDVSAYATKAELEAAVAEAAEAINGLDDKLDDEVERAKAAEGALQDAIDEKQDALTPGKGILIGEDGVITYDEAEIASVEYVDANISDTMSYVIQEDNEEKAARQAGDELLQGKIEAEETRAKAAEAALDAKIDNLGLADIAYSGNVNDLIQDEGDILILNCND